LQPVEEIAAETHRTPNLVTYFADWTHPFDTAAARAACAAGIVPALTWESWSWEDTSKGAPAATQPSYAPRTITAGAYDGYIRRTAAAIKSLGCPIMLRLDQESNGAWYPWAVGTPGMDNTAAQYVAMWRHVWQIFHTVGADNVIWLWSPNIRWQPGVRNLAELYPGNKYVDIVGIDGYLISPGDTPGIVFDSTMRELRSVAPNKPWLIAETGVAAGPNQPAQITALLAAVAANPRLIGLVYLDEPEALGNWSFTGAPASVVAFRRGIDSPTYGQARAGTS
jgi:beta-mannanase